MKYLISIILFSFIFVHSAKAQEEQQSRIKVRNADQAIFDDLNSDAIQYLKGNVKVSHDSTFMHADSATILDKLMTAIGQVIIIQNDSSNVFADSMVYNSNTSQAKLFGNVVVDNKVDQLFSDVLFYNTKTKIATYQDTAILKNSRTKLTSKRGVYNANTKFASFYNQVVVIDSSFEIHADSLDYDMAQDKIIFKGPTWINKTDQEIYCESGFYRIKDGKGYFTKNAFINDNGKISKGDEITFSEADSLLILNGNAEYTGDNEFATADNIIMNEAEDMLTLQGNAHYEKDDSTIDGPLIKYNTVTKETEVEGSSQIDQPGKSLIADKVSFEDSSKSGYARGNVTWIDSAENVSLFADHLEYSDSIDYNKSYGDEINPLFLKVTDEDSMFLSADTLISQKIVEDGDSISLFIAHNDVKIWKSDLQAVADSMYYSSVDSIFRLFGDPIIWADSSQYKGDTIYIKMENNKVKQIEAFQNGFIINQINELYYDQIKGKRITSFLDSSQVKQLDVEGNAEAIYFLKDEMEAFIGPNHTKCSEITFYFNKGELDDIRFFQQPESVLTPIQQASRGELFLPAYDWKIGLKPTDPLTIRNKTNRKISQTSVTLQIDSTAVDENILKDEFEEAVDDILEKQTKKK